MEPVEYNIYGNQFKLELDMLGFTYEFMFE